MPRTDLILLHAPHVYDFRKIPQLYGPVSDLVLSTPAYEMYPIGFSSLAEYLGKAGYHVRLVNIANRMLKNPRFDVETFIRKLKAPVFGIDLHWLVHAHGSIELARLVKKIHPEAKIIFGGFSASYYYQELIACPEVDYVMRGDSTEEPMRLFMQAALKNGKMDNIPNLVWKDAGGAVHDNGLTCVPDDISDVMQNHYSAVVRTVLRYHDLLSTIPVKDWLRYPVTAVLTCKGCDHNCAFCGGANSAMRRTTGRTKTVLRTAQDMFKDIQNISRLSRGPVYVLSDIRMGGEKRAYDLLELLEKHPVKNTIEFELFRPTTPPFLEALARAKPGFAVDISPHSHDIKVRRALGLTFTNEEMEESVGEMLKAGSSRVEIYFMIGLPEQTPESVSQTIDYCEYLYKKFEADKRLFLFIGPLSPFLDPGSPAFENPEKYGYKVIHRTLEDHRNALTQPCWKYTLNYETRWMSRQQIVDSTYDAISRLTRLKAKYGYITQAVSDEQVSRIKSAVEMEKRIDALIQNGGLDKLSGMKPELDRLNGMAAVERRELTLPMGAAKLRYINSLIEVIRGR